MDNVTFTPWEEETSVWTILTEDGLTEFESEEEFISSWEALENGE